MRSVVHVPPPRAFAPLLFCLLLAGAPGCSTGDGGATSGTPDGGGDGGPKFADPYTLQAFDKTRITSNSAGPNFQQATADIDLHDGPFQSVHLIVDLESTCYPFDKWKDNPPPAGQNWPADCDAFDRNFSFSLDDPTDPAKDPPGLELIHAITPFGGPLHLDVDITDVANGLPGKHKLRTEIPTWSDGAGQVSGSNGGWNVSAKIEAVPGPAPRNVLAVESLYYGTQTMAAIPAPIEFEVPAGTVSSKLEFRTSGHGGGEAAPGCIGPAEEFCKRSLTVTLDGAQLKKVIPWRSDCQDLCTLTDGGPFGGQYCLENPCGAPQSVEAPRANWCPGSMTAPYSWEAPALSTPGKHTLTWAYSDLASGGQWKASATYFAYGQ
jgi:hypothetical protein